MSLPWNDRIPRYISIINEIYKSYRTYDIHLHPVEIVLNVLDYKEILGEKGLFTIRGGKFIVPHLEGLENRVPSEEMMAFMKRRPQIISLMLRRTYNHTGPRVFREYFDILRIDRGLLLPVAPAEGPIGPQMSLTYDMFKGDPRFSMAGSVPNTITNQDVECFLRKQVEKYHIVAVKIHPNITAINLNLATGKERVECIIEASARLELPVVIHGGKNYMPDKKTGEYALISNLEDLNLNSPSPVVLAHGGAYGHSFSEIQQKVIPVLKRMLRSYENMFIDVSALDHKTIGLCLTVTGKDRILFGSDALYENQILMLMRLIFALETSKLKFEESLIQILCKNPANVIFKGNCEKSSSEVRKIHISSVCSQ